MLKLAAELRLTVYSASQFLQKSCKLTDLLAIFVFDIFLDNVPAINLECNLALHYVIVSTVLKGLYRLQSHSWNHVRCGTTAELVYRCRHPLRLLRFVGSFTPVTIAKL